MIRSFAWADTGTSALYQGGRLTLARLSFTELSDRHPIRLQRVPSHVGLLGNGVADDLAKAATDNPVDPED
ncbi:hypothetical protein TNCV_3468751 [Trichonephila clavipes]|nr:hypothetical protein TNCV_3468751 [Trichonephila clavipes]